MTARAKKLFSYLLKLSIIALAFWYVYRRILRNNGNLHNFHVLVAHITYTRVAVTLTVIVLLMIVNWLLESLKWWFLMRELHPIPVWRAIESVFCGLTWAVFTPNRLGEYAGRIMFLPNRKRIHGVFAMAVGSFGQNVITNVLGAGASVWFLYSFLNLNSWLMLGITVVAAGFMAIMLVFYFNIRWMVLLLNKVKFLKKFHRFFDIMGKYSTAELLEIMWFCLARFLVFTFQYYLIIHLLIPEIPIWEMSLMMFVFFFIQSAIPSLDFLDIGVRSVTANAIFGYVTNQHIAVIVAVSIIYIINLIIPAILGSAFVFKLKFFDRTA
ncbi:MAG TPA: lysylphosphatidylglycerol synthase domain-containing protein [Mucilaginibacter sp.]|nr:lysylphosphatidylglycerol synthase domain-containing protein [Mucilaginibacter sp.]